MAVDGDATLLQAEHQKLVAGIQERVKHFYDNKQQFRVYHGSTSSTRPTQFAKASVVDVSGLTRLFPVDKVNKTVRVEANVPMDALVAHTLKVGLIPKVVMELKGITCGGGYSGVSGESSSFRYGLFQHICSEVEIVLADGTLMTASRTQDSDLLDGAGGVMGTLGVVTLLTIDLMDAKPYVDLQLTPFTDHTQIPRAMKEAIGTNVEYIDGIYYHKGTSVLMLGRMTDTPGAKVMAKMQVHWFSDNVLTMIQRDRMQPSVVSMKLEDYLFRYDHGAFWGGKLAFRHYHIPNNRITRKLADPLLDSRTCYHALHKTGLANEYVVQDFAIPESHVVAFMNHVSENLPHLQLFMCPGMSIAELGIAERGTEIFKTNAHEKYFGVGVYGRGPRDPTAFVKLNQDLEKKAFELSATKLLYARVYSTEDEFWATYNKAHYDQLRTKFRAETLPDVFQKLAADMSKRPKRRPVMGILETLADKARGKKDYILKRQ